MLSQESVLGNMRSLDGLLGMMAKTSGGKGVVGKAMEALQELFMTCLLPDRYAGGGGGAGSQGGGEQQGGEG